MREYWLGIKNVFLNVYCESHCVGAGSPASSGRMTSEAHVALQSLSALGAAVQLFSGVWSGY